MKLKQSIGWLVKCTGIFMMLLVVFSMKKTVIKADTIYTETIDGIEWSITVSDIAVSIAPVDKTSISGNIEIPSVVQGYTVTQIKSSAFMDCTNLTGVTIPESVEIIGANAFYGCTGLVSVTIPANVTTVNKYAFHTCSSLTDVKLSYGVKVLGRGVFKNCYKLSSIVIPDSVTSCGIALFDNCTGLKYAKVSNSMISIPESMFIRCKNLEHVDMPYGITKIGAEAFYDCNKLTDVEIPDSVTYIDVNAFYICKNIRYLRIPSSVTGIAYGVFGSNYRLHTVIIPTSVKKLGKLSFSSCDEYCKFFYLGTEAQWKSMSKYEAFDYRKDNYTYYFCSPLITSNPISADYIQNEANVTPLSVAATVEKDSNGEPIATLSYQWYQNSTDSNTGGTIIEGATSSTYTPPVTELGEKYYYCEVTSTHTYNDAVRTATLPSKTAKIKVSSLETFTVSFDTNCDITVPDQNVPYGEFAVQPEMTAPEGYVWDKWYTDSNLTSIYNFTTPVTQAMTLYTKLKYDYSSLQAAVDNALELLANTGYISRYTDSSVQCYRDVITCAQQMIEQQNAPSVDAIANMITEVNNAKKLLIIKLSERPVPHVENGIGYVTLHDERLIIHQYLHDIAFNEESFTELVQAGGTSAGVPEATEITLSEEGFYTFQVNDKYGDVFYLVFFYTEATGTEGFDLSELIYEIEAAQNLCTSIPDAKTGLGPGAFYTDPSSKERFQIAINTAINGLSSITSQEDADNMLENLRAEEAVFTASLKQVEWVTIEVDGFTVRVIPMDGCTLTEVRYNDDGSGNLAQGIWNNRIGFTTIPYKTESSTFVWNNVAEGIYTFDVTMEDSNKNSIRGLKCFVVTQNSTKEQVVFNYLSNQKESAEEVLTSLPISTEASDGEMCVPVVYYNRLVNNIQTTTELLETSQPTYDEMIETSLNLSTALRLFLENKREKSSATVVKEPIININNGTITVSQSDLYTCHLAKGSYANYDEFKDSNYTMYWALKSNGTMRATMPVNTNGFYTLRIRYNDDTVVYVQVEVTDVLTAKEEDGIITLSYQGNSKIATTSYAYDDGSENLSYKTFSGFEEKLTALGNGRHVIKVVYADGLEDTIRINVTGCNGPVIIQSEDKLIVYNYGLELQTAIMAKGHFSTWEDMYSNVYNVVDFNTEINTTDFEEGEYTFCFEDKSGESYWRYITIGE